MLLANNAERLLRLLRRFEHVASVAGVNAESLVTFRDLSLYFEAQFRTPIFSRWPALARFLTSQKERISNLASPVVAALCERWLTGTPAVLSSGEPLPLRREFAGLALATARAFQLELTKDVICIGDTQDRIHQAAFSAALDLPIDVAEWALEMAQRRPLGSDIAVKVRDHREIETEKHRARLKKDPQYRARHQGRQKTPTFLPSGRRLPPWPLGPRKRVDHHFSEAVLRSATFQALMRAIPSVASEVLLAVIIEDSPEEKYNPYPLRDNLGLELDQKGYPTAYWKSPFYTFLHINADVALDAILKLVSFCTDRWEHLARRGRGETPASYPLFLSDGIIYEYRGNYQVFKWSQENSLHNGQIHAALAALERWLCDLIDRGVDVTPHIERLLRASDSVATIGVLVNVGKYRIELLYGPLKCILTQHWVFLWDYHRVDENSHAFDAMAWARSGDMIFEMAKAWAFSSYREKTLRQIVSEIISRDADMGKFILAATGQWVPPEGGKEELDFKISHCRPRLPELRTASQHGGW